MLMRGGRGCICIYGVITADCGFEEYKDNTRVEVVMQQDKSSFNVA